tara:strand:+ start:707 stop:1807 length:1101 start_codon:yes stop_codon:yes gene_type:complete
METDLKAFLSSHGMKFDVSDDSYATLLEEHMKSERYYEFGEILLSRHEGQADISDVYNFLETTQEVNLVFSSQSEMYLSLNSWLASKINGYTSDCVTIGELGFGSGTFLGWLANKYPDINFVGLDRMENFIRLANNSFNNSNCRFERWDYENTYPDGLARCDVLISSLGIDFDTYGEYGPLSVDKIRENDYYNSKKLEAQRFFKAWRTAITDEGALHVALRIPTYLHFIALIDAAVESGWAFEEKKFEKILVSDQKIPAFTFIAKEDSKTSVSKLLEIWCQECPSTSINKIFKDAEAIACFIKLENKTVLKTDQMTFSDGNTTAMTIGENAEFGYSFSIATNGSARLEIVPKERVAELEIRFDFDD